MQDVKELFSLSNEKVWIKDKDTNRLLPNNPFHIRGNAVFDVEGKIRDDIVGLFCRGKIAVRKDDYSMFQKKSDYYCLNYPKSKALHRVFSGSGLDYLNILVGNAFPRKDIPEGDKKRLESFFKAISTIKQPVFTETVQDAELFLKRLAKANEEQGNIAPIDPDFPSEAKDRGVLKRIAKRSEQDN